MAGSDTGSPEPEQTARKLRLAAVHLLLADPKEIPDDLEASLYVYRGQLESEAAR